MSINLDARIRRSREPVKPGLVDAFMTSGAACALVDSEARVIRTSEALNTMMPGIEGRSIVDICQVDRAALFRPAPP